MPAPGRSGAPGQPAVRVRLLGRFSLEGPTRGGHALGRRASDLIAFLALHPAPHRRDAVAEALWPSCARENSRKYLRRSLWQARQALAPADGGRALECDGDWLSLCAYRGVWVDVWELDRAYDELAAADHNGTGDVQLLSRALDAAGLYRGDLLEGWDEEWCGVARERYRSIYVSVLEWAVDCCERLGRSLLAQRCCHLLLDLDPAHEWAHRVLMELLWAAGDRTGALRQFDQCAAALDRELGVLPAAATAQLYRRVRDDVAVTPVGPACSDFVGEVSARLAGVQCLLQAHRLAH